MVQMRLKANRARDLMTSNPISIAADSTIHEAVATLLDREITAAPVIDDAGRPIGVISRSDIVRRDREAIVHAPRAPDFYHHADLTLHSGDSLRQGFQVEIADTTTVEEIMTPIIFKVAPDDSVVRVVGDMLAYKIHRLFVVENEVLVGVISAMDVLRHLSLDVT